jgi:hypothetical protein
MSVNLKVSRPGSNDLRCPLESLVYFAGKVSISDILAIPLALWSGLRRKPLGKVCWVCIAQRFAVPCGWHTCNREPGLIKKDQIIMVETSTSVHCKCYRDITYEFGYLEKCALCAAAPALLEAAELVAQWLVAPDYNYAMSMQNKLRDAIAQAKKDTCK